MYNKVQQKFDKSIREAVEATAAAKERESAIGLEKRKRRAALEIPRIEKLIADGKTRSGTPLSKDQIKELREMLEHRQKLISVEVS